VNQEILVSLGKHSYPIEIKAGLIEFSPVFLSKIKAPRVLIITNPTIKPHYLKPLVSQIEQSKNAQINVHLIEDGEKYKNLQEYEKIIGFLLQHHMGRDCLIIALGGGVIGDISGFVAATYQRGIPFIQIPTTLLAQIDASVGGKTAINHPLGKNMMGAFHQPEFVLIDPKCLLTLSQRDYLSGLGEAVKYGILADYDLFCWMEKHSHSLRNRALSHLEYLIRKCCEIKAEVVSNDEKETGNRALLNLGHTYAHAFEAETQFEHYLHGEAVAIGLVAAMNLSVAMGLSTEKDKHRVEQLIDDLGLPTQLDSVLNRENLMEHMQKDKKNKDGKIRLVINQHIGAASLINNIDEELIKQAIPIKSTKG